MISGKWRTVAKNLDSEGNLRFDVTVRLVMLQLAKLLIYVPFQHSYLLGSFEISKYVTSHV